MVENMAAEAPALSIVATSRNDDHGGNLQKRMRLCFNGILSLAERHRLRCELILVDWNPPIGKPKLDEIIPWPEGNEYCTVRIIEVPPDIHNRYKHSAALPLYQMIAKNVGIRRARAPWVLATNIDILFTDALFSFLASGKLEKGKMYRVDRHDCDGDIPEEADIDTQLSIAANSTLRICAHTGTWNLRTGDVQVVNNSSLAMSGALTTLRYPLHTNACGDFTLLARDDWFRLRGYWEDDVFSFHLDSIFCYCAFYAGIEEVCLGGDMWIHHIEHTEGWTPEIEKSGVLDDHLKSSEIARISNREMDGLCDRMSRLSRPLPGNNDDNWGFAVEDLSETRPVSAGWDALGSTDEPVMSHPLPAAQSVYDVIPFTDKRSGEGPYLSIVTVCRLADFRMDAEVFRSWLESVADSLSEPGMVAELIVVDWNSSSDQAPLMSLLPSIDKDWPIPIRLIEVPPSEHSRLTNADRLDRFEGVARNVGARQAIGQFLLFVPPGATFSSEFLARLSARQFNLDCFYNLGDEDVVSIPNFRDVVRELEASESFLLMAREKFIALRGFPELSRHGGNVLTLLHHMAHADGLNQVLLPRSSLILEEVPLGTIDAGLDQDPDLCLHDDREYRPWCEMMRFQRTPVTPNKPSWGLAGRPCPIWSSTSGGRAPRIGQGTDSSQTSGLGWREIMEAYADALKLIEFNEQTPENLEALRSLVESNDISSCTVIGCGSGIALRALQSISSVARVTVVDHQFSLFEQVQEHPDLKLTGLKRLQVDLTSYLPEFGDTEHDQVLVLINAGPLSDDDRSHVLSAIVPQLPAGCLVVISNLWHSAPVLDKKSLFPFFANAVFGELDALRCHRIECQRYWHGGSIVGGKGIGAFVRWINTNQIRLVTPADSNLAVFSMPENVDQTVEDSLPDGEYFYNPAASWEFLEGTHIDPLIKRIMEECAAGETAYSEDEIERAASHFSNALLSFERLAHTGHELFLKMNAADNAGDRAAALRYFLEWRALTEDIGLLKGVKRIVASCEVRLGNLRRALEINDLVKVDLIDRKYVNDIRIRYLRTEGFILAE